MPVIGSVTTTTTSLINGVGGTTGTTPTTPASSSQSAPAFQETLTTQGRIFALGLGAPKNSGDIEALFAEIATKFGAEAETATDYAEAAEDAKRVTSLMAAVGNLALFASLGAAIDAANTSINESRREIAQMQAEIDGLNAQIDGLEQQLSDYSDEWDANAAKQLENVGTILDLGTQQAAAWFEGDTAEVDRLQGLIDGLEAENSRLAKRNDELTGLIISTSLEIADLGLQVTGLEIKQGIEEVSIALNQAQINLVQGLLAGFAVLFMPFSVDLALRTMGEIARASFEVTPDQSAVDQAVQDASDNISELLRRIGELDSFKKSVAQMPANDPATLTALQDFLAGKDVPEGASPEQENELAGAANLLTLLQQLFQSGVGGKSTPTDGKPGAMDLLRAALNENLPEDPEAQQKVATEAAGLASGLALLRSILGQVANGEQAQGTQVPGPSGRLTLAI